MTKFAKFFTALLAMYGSTDPDARDEGSLDVTTVVVILIGICAVVWLVRAL
jgi:hypothetical protein